MLPCDSIIESNALHRGISSLGIQLKDVKQQEEDGNPA